MVANVLLIVLLQLFKQLRKAVSPHIQQIQGTFIGTPPLGGDMDLFHRPLRQLQPRRQVKIRRNVPVDEQGVCILQINLQHAALIRRNIGNFHIAYSAGVNSSKSSSAFTRGLMSAP